MRNRLPPFLPARLLLSVGGAMLLCSCATGRFTIRSADDQPVRKVDFRKAPELADLAEHARVFGNEMYPKICALLLEENAEAPAHFDLILEPIKSGNRGEAHSAPSRIYINTEGLTDSPKSYQEFDHIFTH